MAALTFCVRLGELLVQHSGSNTEVVALLDDVIIVNMEHHVLPPLPLGSNLWVVRQFSSQLHIVRSSTEP